MAIMKAETIYHNPDEVIYHLVANKKLFNEQDYLSQSKLGLSSMYLNAISNSDSIDPTKFYSDYKLYYGNPENRVRALYNENIGDKTTVKKFKLPVMENGQYLYDEKGNVLENDVEMTEYEYTKALIAQENEVYGFQSYEKQKELERIESRNFLTYIADVYSVRLNLGVGFIRAAEGIGSLGGALIDEFLQGFGIGEQKTFAETINKWYTDYAVSDDLKGLLQQFEYKYTHWYNEGGQINTVGKYLTGAADGLGALIPSMIVAHFTAGLGTTLGTTADLGSKAATVGSNLTRLAPTAGQIAFYGPNVFGSSVSELYQEQGQDIPSTQIIANAAIKTALQKGVEFGLGKLFGTSGLDELIWGTKTAGNVFRFSSKNLTSNAFLKLGKNMLQEGLEESLQETSDWFADAAHHFINNDFNSTHWDWQAIGDAFMIAMIMSIVGDAAKIAGTKKMDIGFAKVNKAGEFVINKDGSYDYKTLNKLQSWSFASDLESYMSSIESLSKITDEYVNLFNEKTGQSPNLFTDIKNIDKKLGKVTSKYFAAYYEAITSFKLLAGFYGQIGEERFTKANTILAEMRSIQGQGLLDAETVKKNSESIADAFDNLNTAYKTELAIQANKRKMDKVVNKVNKDTEPENDNERAAKEVIEKLLGSDSKVEEIGITKNGTGPVKVGPILLLPEKLLGQGAKAAIDALVNQELADKLSAKVLEKSNEYFKNEVQIVTDLYRQWIGDESLTEEEAVMNLIFNPQFFEVALGCNEETTASYLLRLNTLVSQEKGKKTFKDELFQKRLNECKSRWIEAAFNFYSNNLEKDASLFTSKLTKEEKSEFNERISKILLLYNMGKDIVFGNAKPELIEFMNRRIDGMDVTDEIKNQLKQDIANKFKSSDDSKKRQKALDTINEWYQGAFNSLYNGEVYLPKNNSIANYAFNAFLQGRGLTLKTIFNSNYFSREDFDYLEEKGQDLSLENVVNMRISQFEELHPNMTFSYENGNIVVIIDGDASGFELYFDVLKQEQVNILKGKDFEIGDKDVERSIATDFEDTANLIKNCLRKSLIDNGAHQFLTVDDIVNHPEYLNEAVREEILNNYNSFDKISVYRYLQSTVTNETDGKKSLVVKNDGTIVMADMTKMKSILNKDNKFTEGTFSIKNFVKSKYLTGNLENVKVTFKRGGGTGYIPYEWEGDVGVVVNTIVIDLNEYSTNAEIEYALCHEFQHAVQTENRLNTGTADRPLDFFSSKEQSIIIETVKRLEPKLFIGIKDEKIIKNIVDAYIYHGSGEFYAYGLGGYGEIGFYPVITSYKKGNLNITFRDGTTFKSKYKKSGLDVTRNIIDQSRDILNKYYTKYNIVRSKDMTSYSSRMKRMTELIAKKNIDRSADENIELMFQQFLVDGDINDFKNSQVIGIEFEGIKYALPTVEAIEELLYSLTRNREYVEDTATFKLFTFSPKDINYYKYQQGRIGGEINIGDGVLSNRRTNKIDLTKNVKTVSRQSIAEENRPFVDFLESEFEVSLNQTTSDVDLTTYDTLEFNGKAFWIAKVNIDTGDIVETWTYKEAENLGFDLDVEEGHTFFTTDLLDDNNKVLYNDFGVPLTEFLVAKINEQLKVYNDVKFFLDYLQNVYSSTLISPDVQSSTTKPTELDEEKEKAPADTEKVSTEAKGKIEKAEGKVVDRRPKGERGRKIDEKKYNRVRTAVGKSKNATRIVSAKDIDKEVAETHKPIKQARGGKYVYRKFVERRYYKTSNGNEDYVDIFDYYEPKGERRHTLKSENETNIKYFTTKKGKSQITMSPGLRKFVIATTGIEDRIDGYIMSKIKNGSLTSNNLLDYVLQDLKEIDDYTFRLILKNVYNNDSISTAKELHKIAFEKSPKMTALYFTLKDSEYEDFLYETLKNDTLDKIWNLFISQTKYAKELNRIYVAASSGKSHSLKTFNINHLEEYPDLDPEVLTKETLYKTILFYNRNIASGSRALIKARKSAYHDGQPASEGYRQSRFGEMSKFSLDKSVRNNAKTTFLDNVTSDENGVDIDDSFGIDADSAVLELSDVTSPIGSRVFKILAEKVQQKYNDYTFTKMSVGKYLSNLNNLSEEQQLALYRRFLNEIDEESLSKLYFLAELPGFEDVIIESEYTKEQKVSQTLDKVVNYNSKVQNIKNRIATIKKYVRTQAERNLVIRGNEDLFDKHLNLKIETYRNEKGYKSIEIIDEISKRVKFISKAAKSNVYRDKKSFDTFMKQYKKNEEMMKKIYDVIAGNKTRGVGKFTNISTEDGNISFKTSNQTEIPETIAKILETGLTRTGISKVQELSSYHEKFNEDGSVDKVYDDRYLKLTMKHLLDSNAELLAELSEDEAEEIIKYYVNDNVILSDVDSQVVSETIRLVVAYILGEERHSEFRHGDGFIRFNFDETLVKKAELKMQEQTHMGAVLLSNQATIIRLLQPEKIIARQMAMNLGFELDEIAKKNIDDMVTAMRKGTHASYKKAKLALESHLIAEYSEKNKQGVLDKLLTWERAMMLCNPGTWVRNYMSNEIVSVGNEASSKIGEYLYKLFPKNKLEKEGQYKLNKKIKIKTESKQITVNGKREKDVKYLIEDGAVDKQIINYINDKFINTGLIDETIYGVSKYDDNISRKSSSDTLVEMMSNSIHSGIRKNYVFKFTGKYAKRGKFGNKVLQLVYKGLNDDPWIKKQAIKYFAQIVEEDFIVAKRKDDNLTLEKYLKKDTTNIYGISKYIAESFTKAVNLASYDYMKSPNFINRMERSLREDIPKGFWFAYKQVFPFLASSWSWCVEGMRYTPAGLITSIYNLAKLENTIDKMDKKRDEAKSLIGGEFARYLQIRNLGKGFIGTIGFIIGGLLCGLGWAGIDDDDDEYKLIVGDVKININDVLGSQGVMLGVALTQNIFDGGKDVIDILAEATNQLFRDSIFQDFINTFRNGGFGDFITNEAPDVLSQFIPSIVKTSAKYINRRGNTYSDKKLVAAFQKFWARNIPLPVSIIGANTSVNPYTGQVESFWNTESVLDLFSRLGPIKVSYPSVSNNELIAIGLGINKGILTGNYEIDGDKIKLNSKELTKLNVLYGKMNNSDLTNLYNGSIKHRVKMPDGTYKELRYGQMLDEQKEAAINTIMSNNGSISKIYILTNTGKYKYYASDLEYEKLRKLGITKNVYRKTNKLNGFVKN